MAANSNRSPTGAALGELVPAGPPKSLQDLALTGVGGLLTGLMRHVLQTGLEVEMSEHLGYGPHKRAGWGSGNSRNGGSRLG